MRLGLIREIRTSVIDLSICIIKELMWRKLRRGEVRRSEVRRSEKERKDYEMIKENKRGSESDNEGKIYQKCTGKCRWSASRLPTARRKRAEKKAGIGGVWRSVRGRSDTN